MDDSSNIINHFLERREWDEICRVATNPYEKNYEFTFRYNDIDLSAMLFLAPYYGVENSNLVNVTEFLLGIATANFRKAMVHPDFWIPEEFEYGNNPEFSRDRKGRFTISNPEMYNYMLNNFPDYRFDPPKTIRLAFDLFVDSFVDQINGGNKYSGFFPRHFTLEESRSLSLKRGLVSNLKNLKVIHEYMDGRKFKFKEIEIRDNCAYPGVTFYN